MPDNHDALFDKNISFVTFQDTFNDPTVYITENGFSQMGPLQMEDVQRCEFSSSTILEVAKGNTKETKTVVFNQDDLRSIAKYAESGRLI